MSPDQGAEKRNCEGRVSNELVSENDLWANVGMISVIAPMAGRIMMYTAGWEYIQKRC